MLVRVPDFFQAIPFLLNFSTPMNSGMSAICEEVLLVVCSLLFAIRRSVHVSYSVTDELSTAISSFVSLL